MISEVIIQERLDSAKEELERTDKGLVNFSQMRSSPKNYRDRVEYEIQILEWVINYASR